MKTFPLVSLLALLGLGLGPLRAQVVAPPAPVEVYHNPVLHGDYPDPSVIRVGEDYYATATSSEWAPYFPILHSRDLVNWEIVSSVFAEMPLWTKGNFWAPELQQWGDRFYVYYVARQKNGPLAIAVATADKPEGPWTDHGPLVSQDAGSIDAMAVEDEHGARWLVWKEDGNSRGQPTPLWAQRFDETGLKLTGERHELLRNDAPWEGALVEGPYIFRRGEWFYLIYSANSCCGRGEHYATGVARSHSLLGPWEKNPANPILDRDTHFRGPGHGSVVTTAEGRSFFLYHAYSAESFTYTGREMMLDEVSFGPDGWLMINSSHGPSDTQPMPVRGHQQAERDFFLDEFETEKLRAGWQWPIGLPPNYRMSPWPEKQHPRRNRDPAFQGLILAPAPSTPKAPQILARPSLRGDYVAITHIDMEALQEGATGSLAALGDPENALGLSIGQGRAVLWQMQRGRRRELARQEGLPSGVIGVRMTAAEGHRFQFSYNQGGPNWKPIGDKLDGDFIPPWDRSVRIALMAEGGEVRFQSFSLLPPDKEP